MLHASQQQCAALEKSLGTASRERSALSQEHTELQASGAEIEWVVGTVSSP